MPTTTPNAYPGTPGEPLYGGIASGVLLTSFSLDNWDSVTPTRTLFRGGMPFKKGDIPSGSVPEIRRAGGAPVVAQFDERSTWSDGSLKFAVCHMRDTDLAASGSQAYEVYSVAGSFDNTGATTLASVVASDALTVEFSSLAEWNGTSSATRGAGAALAAFATHAGVATRVTKIHSGPVCEGWQVWGMVKDLTDGTGAEDAHLKAIWYVDVWKDATDAVIDTEYGVELAQDWWAVANKFRLDYTATLKRNGATVQAYTGLQHPYHSHWMTVQMQDDNNHAKRHWVGDTPTLTYLFDKDYWVSTGLVPPFDTAFVPTAYAKTPYVPCSAQQHRASLDDTGGYIGRGMLPNCDANAFMLQTPEGFRNARTNGFAGLHVNRHYRDERTRTRPSESADVANTLIPLIFTPKADSASTFTGLPTPKNAYNGDASSAPNKGGWVDSSGGSGVWSNSINASHAVQYSAFAYMVEGERYFIESCIDLATAVVHRLNANEFGAMPDLHWAGSPLGPGDTTIPTNNWAAIPDFVGQERSLGWAVNLLSAPAALLPDNDPQGQYMRAWNEHCDDYLADTVFYMPNNVKDAGVTAMTIGGFQRSPWMSAFIVQACCQNHLANETTGVKAYAEIIAKSLAAIPVRNKYDLNMYRFVHVPSRAAFNGSNIFAASEYLSGPDSVAVTSDTLALGTTPNRFANGDVLYFVDRDDGGSTVSLPTGYTAGTPLYVINLAGTTTVTCNLSTSPGGSVFTIPNGTYFHASKMSGFAAINPAVNPPTVFSADSYATIQAATFAYAETAGLSTVPAGTFADVEAFLVNTPREAWAAWKMQVPA